MSDDDLDPIDLDPIDLEPIDLEPIDLEPVDLEPGEPGSAELVDKEWQLEQLRIRRRVWIFWGALATIGLATWGLITLATRDDGKSKPAPVAPVDRLATLTSELQLGLRGIGSGRFAAVIDDRLYLIDRAQPAPTLVRLPEGHAVIQDQNASTLLVSTFELTLVSTRPVGTRTLSPKDTAFRRVVPASWWLVRNNGTIRTDQSPVVAGAPVPAGLRVVAAVRDGFVALAAPDFRWVLWNGSTRRNLAPAGYQLLTTGPRTIVFRHNCGYNGCGITILDLARDGVTSSSMRAVPQFAEFSPDGTHLAMSSTQGDLFIDDLVTGHDVEIDEHLQNAAQPFAWTPDSRSLIVVGPRAVEIVRATDGFATGVIDRTDGVQQIFALP